jgi:hypothetical protein
VQLPPDPASLGKYLATFAGLGAGAKFFSAR